MPSLAQLTVSYNKRLGGVLDAYFLVRCETCAAIGCHRYDRAVGRAVDTAVPRSVDISVETSVEISVDRSVDSRVPQE
jgi:hypothetical protein